MLTNGHLLSHFYLMSLHYIGNINPENCVFSAIPFLENTTALACYIFDPNDFSNFWHVIVMAFELSYVNLISRVVCYYFLNLL